MTNLATKRRLNLLAGQGFVFQSVSKCSKLKIKTLLEQTLEEGSDDNSWNRSKSASALCLIAYIRKVAIRWWTSLFKKQLLKSFVQWQIKILLNHKF